MNQLTIQQNPFVNSTAYEEKAHGRIETVLKLFQEQLRFKNISQINKLEKYNELKVIRAILTPEAVAALLDGDRKVQGLPKFIADFLDLKPSQHRETLILRPELIVWSDDRRYLLMPNPEQSNHELLMEDPKQAKYEANGFGLVSWFIHPILLASSRYGDKDQILADLQLRGESPRYGTCQTAETLYSLKRIHSFSELQQRDAHRSTVGEIVAASNEPYLSGPFDYTEAHLEELKALKQQVLSHLATVYGVDKSDTVDLYFHTHYSVSTTTMHLHVRVNQIHHGLELDKSLTLDDITSALERNEKIKDLFITRGVIHKELKSAPFLEKTGFIVTEVLNPYLV